MEDKYNEQELRNIAGECQEFEHIINAMGYGYSLLNVSPDNYVRRCNDCVNWMGSQCNIFQHEIKTRLNL
ncbi:MAG TPA: hypothetical protein VGL27_11190 [Negativicutes bacterium]|jgi:hypothetical protein